MFPKLGQLGSDDDLAITLVRISAEVALVVCLGGVKRRRRGDFGDDWEHVVAHEGMRSAVSGMKYPRCLAGACPPEDCGGVSGYAGFLQAISDRRHPEHRAMLEWVCRPFDPNDFAPSQVSFDDPRKRWKQAFQE